MTSKQKGILFVALGAVCSSATVIFLKLAYKNYVVDDITLLSIWFGMALPVYIGIGIWRSQKGHFE